MRVWEVATGKLKKVILAHTALITRVAFSPDGALAASCANDNSIALWDTTNWGEEKRVKEADVVDDVSFSPDGTTLAWISTTYRDFDGNQLPNNGWLTIWNIPTGKRFSQQAGEGSYFRSFAYSPDGKWLVLLRDNGFSKKEEKNSEVILWNTRVEKIEKTLASPDPYTFIRDFIFTADSDHLLACTMSGLLEWDIATGKVQPTALHGAPFLLPPLRARNDSLLLTGDMSGTTQIWDFHAALTGQNPQPRVTLYNFTNGLWLIATPDGYFDCSPEITKAISWRQGGKVYPYAQFEKQYHRPDLVGKALAE